ncbi:hypothetical protein Tco_1108436 [Tanacetum coccineum]
MLSASGALVDNARRVGSIRAAAATWVPPSVASLLLPFCFHSSLIPLSRGSFDVIVGMDWLSKRKFVIVCHEKVVRIPLEGDEILRVHGERTQGVVKTLMNTKSKEEHEVHLKLVLESLRKEKLYAKFSKLGDALSRNRMERLKSKGEEGRNDTGSPKIFDEDEEANMFLNGDEGGADDVDLGFAAGM